MDRQEAALRKELERTGVSVTRSGDHITLNMPGNITFKTDSSDLNASFFDVLNSVGKVVNEFEQTVIEVAGHTDSTGSDQYNQELSQRRADARRGVPQDAQRSRGPDHHGRRGRETSGRVERHARRTAAQPARRAHARAADREVVTAVS